MLVFAVPVLHAAVVRDLFLHGVVVRSFLPDSSDSLCASVPSNRNHGIPTVCHPFRMDCPVDLLNVIGRQSGSDVFYRTVVKCSSIGIVVAVFL